MDLRPLGGSGIWVSPLGLGSVKFGRNEQVKYPHGFEIPDDHQVGNLLSLAQELGINLIDTAPAYGNSEDRIGSLLPGCRSDWVISTKVGESFIKGQSRFDFSSQATRLSVEQSLRRLNTDYLDLVLIHSDGDDIRILDQEPVLETLESLKDEGKVRAVGLSGKSVEGGLRALECCDLVMVTCNLLYNDELPVLEAAAQRNKGVLIKKGLMSGHLQAGGGIEASMRFVYSQPGVSSMIIGTINPEHLRHNVLMAARVLSAEG